MRLLLWHCAELSYVDRQASSRPTGIGELVQPPQSGHWRDVLAVFVCVEAGDSAWHARASLQYILEALRRIGRREVVLVPFAHLSPDTAAPEEALPAIESLAALCRSERIETSLASFGYNKGFSLSYEAKGHPGSVGYREVRR